METGSITENIDVAQVILYAFWLFFFGLIFYLRREDRREGYPLENETTGRLEPIMLPAPKQFALPHGGTVSVPNDVRDQRKIAATGLGGFPGTALQPTGNPMLDAIGPGTYA